MQKNLLKFVPLDYKLYWAGIVSSITLLSSSNVLKFPIRWKIPIIGVFVLSGCITKWKRNSFEKKKKLSKTSTQGIEEFKNEVMLTAKLLHVNFVQVLGFCIEMDEKMLIYEYMLNKSLDFYLFGLIYFLFQL